MIISCAEESHGICAHYCIFIVISFSCQMWQSLDAAFRLYGQWTRHSHSLPSSAKVKNDWSHTITSPYAFMVCTGAVLPIESGWNVMAHGDAWEGKWRGNWQMEWVASTLHTTLEHGVSSITTADAHTSAASSRLNWCPRRFKLTRPFRWKTKSGFCMCAITFQTQSAFMRGSWLLREAHRVTVKESAVW
jgi:hypothetical protein